MQTNPCAVTVTVCDNLVA